VLFRSGPDYFDRLWCNFEIACFATLVGLHKVDFVPLYLPALVVFAILTFVCVHGLRIISLKAGNVDVHDFPILFVLLIVAGAWLSRAVRLRCVLDDQLLHFKLSNAKCFCCSVNHVQPDTGATIPCDRKFVESSICNWFEEHEEATDANGIDAFERIVHDVLGGHVQQLLGHFDLPFSAGMHFGFLHVWSGVEKALLLSPSAPVKMVLVIFEQCVHFIIIFLSCSSMQLLFRTSQRFPNFGLFDRHPPIRDTLIGLMFAIICTSSMVVWLVVNILSSTYGYGNLLLCVDCLIIAMFCLVLRRCH